MTQRGSIIPVIALLFGAAVVVTIFGYMMWPKDDEIVSNSSIDTNKIVHSNSNVSVASDKTADWKEYYNSVLNYSLRYPKEWQAPKSNIEIAQFGVGTREPFWIEKVKSIEQQLAVAGSKKNITIDGLDSTQQIEGGESTYIVTYIPSSGEYLKVAFDQTLIDASTALLTLDIDPISQWNVYKSSAYGFTLRYPAGYKKIVEVEKNKQPSVVVSSKNTVIESDEMTALLSAEGHPTVTDAYPTIEINVFPIEHYAYIDRPGGAIYVYDSVSKKFFEGYGEATIRDAKLATAVGVNTTGFITGTGDMGCISKVLMFVDERHQRVVELTFGSCTPLDGSSELGRGTKNTEIWKEIAKTFTFGIDTASWKTYTNTTHRYSMKYPGNWVLDDTHGPSTVMFLPPDAASKSSIERSPAVIVSRRDSSLDSREYPTQYKVTINGQEVIRAEGGALYHTNETVFQQSSGYISISWPADYSDDYPEYEEILYTFNK